MDDAGGRDDLVSGIASEVQPPDRAADIQREGPDVNPRKHPAQLGIIQISVDAAQFGQLADLPDDDRGDAPRVPGEQRRLAAVSSPARA